MRFPSYFLSPVVVVNLAYHILPLPLCNLYALAMLIRQAFTYLTTKSFLCVLNVQEIQVAQKNKYINKYMMYIIIIDD